jgi:hypothetical protein
LVVTAVNHGRLLRPWDAGVPAEVFGVEGSRPCAQRSSPAGGALVGGAAVAVSAALAGTAEAGEREPAFSGRRHGLRDLTHELKTSFPPFAPGEEPVRETVATIEDDGYYMQKWSSTSPTGRPGTRTRS